MCYRKFLTFWTTLEHPGFLDNPTAVTIRTHLHVGMMEQMVLSTFLISGRVTPHIRGAQASVDGPRAIYGASAVKKERLQALLYMFRDHAPALFYLGYRVRTLHRRRHDAWTGADADEVLQFSTVILMALRDTQGRQQYLDATLLALLHWEPYLDALPGASFCEEKLESTLGELQQAKKDNPTIITVGEHAKHYRYLNWKPDEPRDLTEPHLARRFTALVQYRTRRLITRILVSTLPYMLLTSQPMSQDRPYTAWPPGFTFLDRLWVDPPDLTVKVQAVKLMRNLMAPIELRDGTTRMFLVLCHHVIWKP